MTTGTLFLVNGRSTSAAAERARRVAAALGEERTILMYRVGGRARDVARFAREAARTRFDSVYAMELAVVPAISAALAWRRRPVIVDTGDAPADFLKLVSAGKTAVLAAEGLERMGYGVADRIIVRGSHHEKTLRERGYTGITVVPDGVDLDVFRPVDDRALRRRLGLERVFTVGIQGNFTWYPSLGGGLGRELVEAIALRRDRPVHAVLIGEGPGIPELRALARTHGIAERLHVMGKVPYQELPRYLGLCDVCLLTQTNDPSSWVRTTGKLPGYLAAGRYVLASRVGTAADLLPQDMLIDYHGAWDDGYPGRLAERIAVVMQDSMRARRGLELRALADQFEYGRVARMAAEVVRAAKGRAR
jgi:glycosyltransferase involved in cell wall biosynthesis